MAVARVTPADLSHGAFAPVLAAGITVDYSVLGAHPSPRALARAARAAM